tara:strand:+ start:1731 stop:1919 length:189 start_codon:yes stop_codon:yes gene_type:complete
MKNIDYIDYNLTSDGFICFIGWISINNKEYRKKQFYTGTVKQSKKDFIRYLKNEIKTLKKGI